MTSFLYSEIPNAPKENCRFTVIPVPYENTVSYGGGTRKGPEAILKASGQLELFDGIDTPGKLGIHTTKAIKQKKPEKMLNALENRVSEALGKNSVPVVLGGEHTVSLGAIRALKAEKLDFGIVQIDAHADLRSQYEGTPYSHACVMRRALELDISLYQLGVRAYCEEEARVRRDHRISFIDARELVTQNVTTISLPEEFPEKVYLTIDIDGLDPSIVSETGTPVPGGIGWYQCLNLIESLAKSREIIGFDLVELSPKRNSNLGSYTAAELVYKTMGFIGRHSHSLVNRSPESD